ncbi:TonB-dependent receptor [bacterium]|nr:MAG: TonB-dependent receptor [bacterium]
MNKRTFLFILICLASVSVRSQEKKNDKADSTYKLYQLEGITVTATRIPEPIIEVPLAVTVIGRSQIQSQRGYGLNDALSYVPGVLAQSRSGNQDIRISIRGFGARGAGDRSNAGTSRGVRVLMDGIPETEPDGRTSFDMVDLNAVQNMEVVRSNASAIWGNAGGGVVSISTVPYFEKPYANASAKFGSFGLQEYFFQAGTVVGETRFYANYTTTSFDGWRVNSASERDIVNLGIVSSVSDATTLGVHLVGTRNLFHIPGPLNKTQYDSSAKQSNPTYLSRVESRNNKTGRIGVTLEHQINDDNGISAMAYINPKYLQRSERNTYRDFTRYHVGGNVMYRHGWSLSSSVKNVTLIGMDEAYQDGAILFYSLTGDGGRGNELRDNKREGANSFGSFMQNETDFHENISVILGLRYDVVKYFNENFINTQLGLQTKSFTGLTPKAGISYRFTEKHSVYANVGGGVEVPAGNETDPAGTLPSDTAYAVNPLLKPIRSLTTEIGTKQVVEMADDGFFQLLTYDAAFYWIQVKNDIIPYKGGRFYFTAGKTQRIGAELGVNLKLDHGFSIQSSASYSNNRYVNYTVDSVHYGRPGQSADYKDNKVAGVPDLFYSSSLRYAPERMKGGFIELGFQGVGKYFVDDANQIQVPSYAVFNATLGLDKPIQLSEHLFVRAFFSINNLMDKKYAGSAFVNPDMVDGKPVYLEPGLPRNFVFSMTVGWN